MKMQIFIGISIFTVSTTLLNAQCTSRNPSLDEFGYKSRGKGQKYERCEGITLESARELDGEITSVTFGPVYYNAHPDEEILIECPKLSAPSNFMCHGSATKSNLIYRLDFDFIGGQQKLIPLKQ
jgi:hypothetical protein